MLITVLYYLFLLWHVRHTPTLQNANNSSQFRFPLVLPQDYSCLLWQRNDPLRWWHIKYALIFVSLVFQPGPYCAWAEMAQYSKSTIYFRVASLRLSHIFSSRDLSVYQVQKKKQKLCSSVLWSFLFQSSSSLHPGKSAFWLLLCTSSWGSVEYGFILH